MKLTTKAAVDAMIKRRVRENIAFAAVALMASGASYYALFAISSRWAGLFMLPALLGLTLGFGWLVDARDLHRTPDYVRSLLAASMPAIIEYTLREDLVTPR